jgi:hypothetical protein
MYNSFAELENGKSHCGANGAASEPTHIIPKILIFAWKELATYYLYV